VPESGSNKGTADPDNDPDRKKEEGTEMIGKMLTLSNR
jgi:hypothetical protein